MRLCPSTVTSRGGQSAVAHQARIHSDMQETPRLRAQIDFMVEEFAGLQAQLNPPA